MPAAKAFSTRPENSYWNGFPNRLRALVDWVLGGKMDGGDVAHAVAVLIDSLEHAPGAAGSRRH